MTNLKVSPVGIVVLLLAHVGLIAHFYPILPESVPMRFGARRRRFLQKRACQKAIYMNVPNREYWFAPERRYCSEGSGMGFQKSTSMSMPRVTAP